MGERFFQYWHGLYNDYDVVCDGQSLDRLIAEDAEICMLSGLTSWFGKRSPITPLVHIGKDTVRVSLAVHSWPQGLNEEIYILRRSFPHTILDREVRALAPSICLVLY